MDDHGFFSRVALFLFVACLSAPVVHAQEGTLRGRVTDAETGAPVPRANLVLDGDGTATGTSTDTTGAFQIRLAPGRYQLRLSATGYRTRTRMVEVERGDATTLALPLTPQSYSLNEIVVSGAQGGAAQSMSTVQRIEPQAIEQQDAADVSELASLVPATHVQTNSRGQTILYFRNAGDRQVGQFFDGALLNIPWDNRVDISLIPASVVEGVTVTKGVPSVRYGANVLGGAINFQSRTLDAPGQQTELTAVLGTAEQRRATVTHLGRTGQWDYTAAVQYAARGDQPLADDADLANNQPLADRRVNTDRQLVSSFGRASYRLEGGGQMGVSLLHVDAEQGVAPEGNATNPQTRYWRYPLWQKTTLIASGQTTIGPNTSVRGAAWGSRFAQDIADYRSVAYDTLNQVQQGRDLTAGFRAIGSKTLPVGTLTLALNGLISQHEKGTIRSGETDAEPDSTTTFEQHIFSAGLEYEAQLHPRVEVSAGANLDGADYPQTGPFPKRDPFYAWGVTSGLRVEVAEGWALRGSAGRKSRFPTMRELYGAAIGKFVPNPSLKPVTAWIGEVGFEHRSESFFFGSTAFLNRVRNTIDKTTLQEGPNAGKEKRINLDGARIYGVETTARWTPTEALLLDGNVTWSRPRGFAQDGDPQKLDEKPGVLGTGTASYDFASGVSVMAQARYTGNVYARNDDNDYVELPSSPSTVLDARISYELSSLTDQVDGRIYVRAENLTDEVVYIGLGLPRPGRSVRVGLDLTL
jgi:iron complex outermembrane receptor protein